jgi:hypothetical protein
MRGGLGPLPRRPPSTQQETGPAMVTRDGRCVPVWLGLDLWARAGAQVLKTHLYNTDLAMPYCAIINVEAIAMDWKSKVFEMEPFKSDSAREEKWKAVGGAEACSHDLCQCMRACCDTVCDEVAAGGCADEFLHMMLLTVGVVGVYGDGCFMLPLDRLTLVAVTCLHQ